MQVGKADGVGVEPLYVGVGIDEGIGVESLYVGVGIDDGVGVVSLTGNVEADGEDAFVPGPLDGAVGAEWFAVVAPQELPIIAAATKANAFAVSLMDYPPLQ